MNSDSVTCEIFAGLSDDTLRLTVHKPNVTPVDLFIGTRPLADPGSAIGCNVLQSHSRLSATLRAHIFHNPIVDQCPLPKTALVFAR